MTAASYCVYCERSGVTYPHYCTELDAPLDAPPDMGGLEKLAIELNPTTPNRFDPYKEGERMTIQKIGTVTITEDRVLVEHFHFGNFDTSGSAGMEALKWAQGRLAEAVVEERESLSRITGMEK